jgi:hypothetical protein
MIPFEYDTGKTQTLNFVSFPGIQPVYCHLSDSSSLSIELNVYIRPLISSTK